MKVLVALDKFKNALTAQEAVDCASEAIEHACPSALCWSSPLTDGGEGFATILNAQLGGEIYTIKVPGPRFHPVDGKFCLVPWRKIPRAARTILQLPEPAQSLPVAFVEMASASGYECLSDSERDPWQTTSYGTGVLMREAVNAGAGCVVLGIGGSATNDCGAGALEALGVVYYDKTLQPVTKVVPNKFAQIHTLGGMSHLRDAFPPVRIANDVKNPLLGQTGASTVFGPQKGLRPEDLPRMERHMEKMGFRLLGLFGRDPEKWPELLMQPGTGAAGGMGLAIRHAFPDSQLVDGFALVKALMQLDERLNDVDCLITGEGRLDPSSLSGKGPVALLEAFGTRKTCHFLAGSCDPETVDQLTRRFPRLRVHVLSDPAWPLPEALKRTAEQIRSTLRQQFKG